MQLAAAGMLAVQARLGSLVRIRPDLAALRDDSVEAVRTLRRFLCSLRVCCQFIVLPCRIHDHIVANLLALALQQLRSAMLG